VCLNAVVVPTTNAAVARAMSVQQTVRIGRDYNRPMHKHTALVAIAIVGLTFSLAGQGARRDGRWEVKMEMDIPGVPAGMPPITTTQCITPEEAKDPQKSMPQGRGGRGMSGDCKVSDFKESGNKVSWSMTCEGPPPTTGTGEFVYGADTYTGTIKMDRGGQVMSMKYSGKRLGDCTK
jgi:uncharacterized protein DUF3617